MRVHRLIPLLIVLGCSPPPPPEMPDLGPDYVRLSNALTEVPERNSALVRAMMDLAAAHQSTHGDHGPGPESRAIEKLLEAIEDDAEVDSGLALEIGKLGRRLLAEGVVKPNEADGNGGTTLDWAGEGDDPAIQAVLVEAGADSAVAAAATRSRPGALFRDCSTCPEMVVVPVGSFMMGSSVSEEEGPRHRVTIGSPFAVGVHEVTFAEWDGCVRAGGCGGYRPDDEGWGRGSRPVIHVSWNDAQGYVQWLSRETGVRYRLLSEAQWEYVARAGTTTARYWGESETGQCRNGNGYDRTAHAEFAYAQPATCSDGYVYTAPVGSFQPNAFGLYDVLGNVHEWTDDCWNDDYSGTPSDGSAFQTGECSLRVLRGSTWLSIPGLLRSAYRGRDQAGNREDIFGFRVARIID